jgi:hypothetical protein
MASRNNSNTPVRIGRAPEQKKTSDVARIHDRKPSEASKEAIATLAHRSKNEGAAEKPTKIVDRSKGSKLANPRQHAYVTGQLAAHVAGHDKTLASLLDGVEILDTRVDAIEAVETRAMDMLVAMQPKVEEIIKSGASDEMMMKQLAEALKDTGSKYGIQVNITGGKIWAMVAWYVKLFPLIDNLAVYEYDNDAIQHIFGFGSKPATTIVGTDQYGGFKRARLNRTPGERTATSFGLANWALTDKFDVRDTFVIEGSDIVWTGATAQPVGLEPQLFAGYSYGPVEIKGVNIKAFRAGTAGTPAVADDNVVKLNEVFNKLGFTDADLANPLLSGKFDVTVMRVRYLDVAITPGGLITSALFKVFLADDWKGALIGGILDLGLKWFTGNRGILGGSAPGNTYG